jgi:hypothetical protein
LPRKAPKRLENVIAQSSKPGKHYTHLFAFKSEKYTLFGIASIADNSERKY